MLHTGRDSSTGLTDVPTDNPTPVDRLEATAEYRNPYFFQKIGHLYGIDAFGTCFFRTSFDPGSLPACDFYDRLAEEQDKLHAAAEEQRQKSSTIAFHRGEVQSGEFGGLKPGLNFPVKPPAGSWSGDDPRLYS